MRLPRNTVPFSAAALAVLLAMVSSATGAEPPRAPDFTGNTGWLNTDRPLSMADLKGQVVLLDFWTYCCINCIHIFPDLKFLEEKYKDRPFVVVGVHSGKFDQEKDADHIRSAILRHNISHPVTVDSDYAVWNAYGVQAWPTLVLIDPEGRIVKAFEGEGHREELDAAIDGLLAAHAKTGTLSQKPLTFKTERQAFKSGVLEFPGKVLADAKGKRLFISDTNHHRVLVADLDGNVTHVIGSGQVGLTDGTFESAQFHQPQGLAISPDGNTLYVADTENHAVRAVDLAGSTVATLAGTGKQGRDRKPDGTGKSTALSSPWDLALVGDRLYVAMAGTHQIWVIDLPSDRVSLFAGTGRESAVDGPNLKATFAQPSGLASDGKSLYVADAEVSSIRKVTLGDDDDGLTFTLAGSGGLFEFGRTDGPARRALFQHPLGVALYGENNDVLFVADTFNHLIRRMDLKAGDVETWLGTGTSDPGDEKAIGFYEPGGISIAGDTLYVADTNHHRIVEVNIPSKKARVLDVRITK